MTEFYYQIPPPPFPSYSPNHTINAYDRFHGTLDGSWRGGWGNGSCGTYSWKDPSLRDYRPYSAASISLADYRRREGAAGRKERLKRVWNSLPTNKTIRIESNYDFELLKSNKSWTEFCNYTFNKEFELWNIYKQLDTNNDMKLDKHELRIALKKASIHLDDENFDQFFNTLDQDNSGVIEFADFRDYLLLLPRHPHITEIYRYYTVKNQSRGASQLTSDADVILTADESSSRSKPKTKLTAMSITPNVDHGHSKHLKHIEYDSSEELEQEDEDSCTSGLLGGSQALKFLLAGGIAGAVSRTSTAPFDRLKVYLITTTKKTNMSGLPALYSAMHKIYVQGGGVKAFWVGNGLNIVKIFPESAIKFLSYETAKRVFAKHWDKVADQTDISGTSRFIAGGVGGITSQFVIYPVETVKTRMMSSASQTAKATILQTAKDIYLKAGPSAFYRGLPAGLFGVFPYSGA